MALFPLLGIEGWEFRRSQTFAWGLRPSRQDADGPAPGNGSTPGTRPRGHPEGTGSEVGLQAPPIPVGIPGPARGRPLPGLLARACSPAPPYLAFSSASTARRSMVLKRLFMSMGRVATAEQSSQQLTRRPAAWLLRTRAQLVATAARTTQYFLKRECIL